jgi:hypothetical protein
VSACVGGEHGGLGGVIFFFISCDCGHCACAATASLLIAGGFVGSFLSAVDARAEGSSGVCQDAAGIAVLPAPIAPWRGAPLRVLFAADKPLEGELSLIAPNGSIAAKSSDRNGGPPYFWFAEVASPAAGTWRAMLVLERMPAECHTITREIAVSAQKPPPLHSAAGSLWPLRNTWSHATEDLYSAWIAKLFDAPLDAELSWPALHLVLRDRSRNLPFNYLGVAERTLSYIGGVISGRETADQLGGPIRIAQVSGQVASEGLPSLFSLAAVLSCRSGSLICFRFRCSMAAISCSTELKP